MGFTHDRVLAYERDRIFYAFILRLPYHMAIQDFDMNKGGRTSTTWGTGSTWRNTEIKTIRVPVVLADEIMEYAKALDAGIAVSQGNTAEVILKAIEKYIEFRQQHHHPNQHSSKPEISSRPWDELRRFQKLVQENPAALNINDHDTCRSHSAGL